MRHALPSGTVTFLFTDIEGSTRLLHELGGEGYAAALAEHRRVLREAFASHGGVEVDTQGDAFFVAFPTAPAALAAAEEALQALHSGPIRVRIGVHTGTPHVAGEGYVGVDVHRAARIAGCGHGGQVVVSSSTASLVEADGLRDLGEHRLKDLTAAERLYQLGDGDFPPLKTLHQTNLPIQPTPLIGRTRELLEAGALLAEHRLVTLIGTGGTGKTRLALQLAAEAVEAYPDGVWWVPLQAIRDPQLVEPAIVQAVGSRGGLADYLRDKRLLLVLDNFEQLLAAAPFLGGLLQQAPEVRMVVTSREPLRLSGERQYLVDSLPLDEAVALFVDRARAVVSTFEPSPTVGVICGRLDGLPLAIELAAARVNVLDADALLVRLDKRLPFLTGGARDAPERQRTLRATIEWSYALLSPDEQRLFARLAVFAGSFDVNAAETVCEVELDTLQALVERSLIRRWGSGRFGMLDTIQEYARERLESSGESGNVEQRHAGFFLARAETAARELGLGDQAAWFDRLEADHDNLRAALAWFRQSRKAALELRLAASLYEFWLVRGHYGEGRAALEHALLVNAGQPTRLRSEALLAASSLAWRQGDYAASRTLVDELLALNRELGDQAGVARALSFLGVFAQREADYERARSLYQESSTLSRGLGDREQLSTSLRFLGDLSLIEGAYDQASALYGESAALRRALGDKRGLAASLCGAARAASRQGRADAAVALLRESLGLCAELSYSEGFFDGFQGAAVLAATEGDHERAARLFGRADAFLAAAEGSLPPAERELHERAVAAVQAALGEDAFARAWAEGRMLTVEDALADVRAARIPGAVG